MASLDYEQIVIRDAAILTNSYVASIVRWIDDNLNLTDKNQVILYLDFTIGSLTSLEIKAEFSPDNVTFYQETSIDITSGTGTVNLFEYTITASGQYRLAIPVKDKYMKVSAKGTGTTTSSSLKITNITWIA